MSTSQRRSCRSRDDGLAGSAHARDALQLDRDRRRQRGDAQRGAAGRRRRIGEVFRPDRVVGLEIQRHVGEEHRHVDEVFPARARRFEHRAHIRENLAGLRRDVMGDQGAARIAHVAGNPVAAGRARTDPGQEQQVAHAPRVWIRANRGGRGIGGGAFAHR